MPASACSRGGPERTLGGNLPLLMYGPPYCWFTNDHYYFRRVAPSVLAFLSHFVITPIHNSTHAVTSDTHNPLDDVFYRTNPKRLSGDSIPCWFRFVARLSRRCWFQFVAQLSRPWFVARLSKPQSHTPYDTFYNHTIYLSVSLYWARPCNILINCNIYYHFERSHPNRKDH